MATSRGALTQQPDYDIRLRILDSFFHVGPEEFDSIHFQTYFKYYEKELAILRFGTLASTSSGSRVLADNHVNVIEMVEMIRSTQSAKSKLCDNLRVRFPGDEIAAYRTLDLVLRLWLMVNIREPEAILHAPQTRLRQWTSNQTLEGFLSQTFPTSRWDIDVKDNRLHPSFTAAFMVNVCGLKLEWTDCLADHLRLDRRFNALRIYPYKAVLYAHLRTSSLTVSGARNSPFPEGLVLETIWSLNLLFPPWDPDTNSLLKQRGQDFQQIGPYDEPPTLNLSEFQYWRDRLSETHDLVFKSPPVSWAQLWRDRRSPQHFWTFWLAFLILLLTLISTAASIVQAWASIRS